MEASEKAWLERQRAERDEEFAPPSFYYDSAPSTSSRFEKSSKHKQFKKELATNVSENQPEIKDQTSSSGDKVIGELIGKQVHRIRQAAEKCDPDLEDKSENPSDKSDGIAMSTRENIPPYSDTRSHTSFQSTTIPAPSFLSSDLHITPPNMSFLPPNLNVPPPNSSYTQNINIHVPVFNPGVSSTVNSNIPPPNYNIPPPNVNFPPPNYNISPPGTQGLLSNMQMPSTDFSVPPPGFYATSNSSIQTPGTTQPSMLPVQQPQDSSNAGSVKPKKVIPKMSIIDTRLMGDD